MTTIKNRPGVVTLALMAVLAAHVLGAHYFQLRSLASLLGSKGDDAWGLYASAAGAIAIVGGFAGVVVVFAMTANPRFARMRIDGEESLEANWVSVVASSMLAAAGSIAAAIVALGGHGTAGAWIFEGTVLVAAHASLRLLWLLSKLIKATRRQDEADERKAKAVTYEDIVSPI